MASSQVSTTGKSTSTYGLGIPSIFQQKSSTLKSQGYAANVTTAGTGTDADRRQALLDRHNVGGFVVFSISGSGTIKVHQCALPRFVKKAKAYLGNQSTNPTKDQPAFFPINVEKLFWTVMEEDETKDLPFLKGVAFKGSKFKDFAAAALLSSRTQYVIVLVPVAWPLSWGMPPLRSGELSDEALSVLESTHPWFTPFMTVLEKHTTAKGKAIADHLTALESVLPTVEEGTFPTTDPSSAPTMLSVIEQEETYEDECAALSEELQSFQPPPPNQTLPHSIALSAQGDECSQLNDGGGTITSVIPTTPSPSTKAAARVAKFECVFGAVSVNAVDGSTTFHPPSFHDEVLDALRESDAKSVATYLWNIIQERTKDFKASRDYHVRGGKLHITRDSIVMAWIANLKSSQPPTSMRDLITQSVGVSSLHFLPDTAALIVQRRVESQKAAHRANQEMMGEHETKVDRVNTKALVVSEIVSLEQLASLCSNYTLLAASFVTFDPTDCEPTAPLFHKLGYKASEGLTDGDVKEWVTVLEERRRMAFLYWAFQTIDRIARDIWDLSNSACSFVSFFSRLDLFLFSFVSTQRQTRESSITRIKARRRFFRRKTLDITSLFA